MNEQVDPKDSTVGQTQAESTPIEPEVEPVTRVSVEEFKISGDNLIAKVKELIDQGNLRRIIIKNKEGQILLEIPLTVGVVGGLFGVNFFPVIAALGAIGALVVQLTIVVEKKE
ncbi:MAG: DUF4342 domain-containing protein [Symploca sp. SIO3E6]|nr:DUF4342 domain-containing protein [Caldora sp. SIO3E6]